jgi:hypothetical protein
MCLPVTKPAADRLKAPVSLTATTPPAEGLEIGFQILLMGRENYFLARCTGIGTACKKFSCLQEIFVKKNYLPGKISWVRLSVSCVVVIIFVAF